MMKESLTSKKTNKYNKCCDQTSGSYQLEPIRSTSVLSKICVVRMELYFSGPSIQSTQKGRDTTAISNE